MKSIFRVCIIVPQGYRHSLCFIEIGFLLKHSLESLGFSCDIALNDLARDRINIVLGWHLIRLVDELAHVRYIPFQLEQLSDSIWKSFPDSMKQTLSHAFDVWDYSPENITFLKDHGIAARQVPLGYHQSLEQIPRGRTLDTDVLFYGSLCDRRRAVLEQLSRDTSITIRSLFDVYGKDRDECIARSRIILNIHFYDTRILEAVRISYLLNNRRFVVSELSEINPYPAVHIPMFEYMDLADACRDFLKNKEDIDSVCQANYQEFKEAYPMTELLKNALSSVNFYD
jgi:hypothetical protein